MDFVFSGEGGLWSDDRGLLVAIKRNGFEMSLGEERDGTERWLSIVNALPEDRIDGHPGLLGRETYEVDADYDANVILRTFPDADFSPEAFLTYARARTRQAAQNTLHGSDWMVIRNVETNVAVPSEVTSARAAVRASTQTALERLADLSPSEYLDFAPTEVHAAAVSHQQALQAALQ